MHDPLLWILITIQIGFGAADTLIHHEMTERLPWRRSQKKELRLHGVRNFFYAGAFLLIGWSEPKGGFAAALLVLLGLEVLITLWDFVEEDRTRRLPPSERVLHTLLALNYGAILALMAPVLLNWSAAPLGLVPAYYGAYSWLCVLAAVGTALFGARDLAAAQRLARIPSIDASQFASVLRRKNRVLITGGTGFVGARLTEALVKAGHDVTVLTRNSSRAGEILPAPLRLITALDQIGNDERIDAIIHLAGEPISDGLWTQRKKARVINSRVKLTEQLVTLAMRLERKPECFIAASAVGWYGMRGPEALMETHCAETQSFSHQSCEAVEAAARAMERQNVRTVRLRIGLVLGVEGGLLARMLTPFELGIGGPFGDGGQFISWITRDDLVRLIVHAIAHRELFGAVNATAPGAVSNAVFSETLGRVLNRPAVMRIPAFPLRFVLGQFAEELLLGGQNVKPDKVQATGFVFAYPALEPALRQMCSSGSFFSGRSEGRLHKAKAANHVLESVEGFSSL